MNVVIIINKIKLKFHVVEIDRIDGWLGVLRQHALRILLLQADHDVIVPRQQGRLDEIMMDEIMTINLKFIL